MPRRDVLPRDHCPFPRPFPPDFAACPGFEPASFAARNLTYKPLPVVTSCAHLAVGNIAPGWFYARCVLGGPDAIEPRQQEPDAEAGRGG
jgi:hypothetical protein